MRIYYLVTGLAFLLLSCTHEGLPIDAQGAAVGGSVFKSGITGPENPLNPYDSLGQLRNDVFEAFSAGNHDLSTIAAVKQQVIAAAQNISGFTTLSNGAGVVAEDSHIAAILTAPSTPTPTVKQ